MDAPPWVRVKAVFQRAFEHSPAEQAAILDAECAGDAELRKAVERLLRAHARTAGLLDSPPLPDLEVPAPPARIGPYRVVRALGRGGMGTVYLAERDESGMRMMVAVKVVRPGMDTAFVVRRFRTERQILAALEHPGIARLYDGGTTDDGLPYFVMEYVPGEDLLTYCDERRLPIATRLQLFLRVCEAVQYAHQSLVVHRDLKPSNVLVTADGSPKLLDFGIAKLLAPQVGGEETEETASVIRLMTPDYASPEQVRGQRVTTASDVYSLGVILYELLCGRRPYRVKSGAAMEIERALLEQDVAPPSAAAAGRQRRSLRGDLDNVVLKAMRRDQAERYATAAELADDLRRHLEGFPVQARASRRIDRAAKFLRRHRVAAVAAAAVLASLVTGLGVAVRQARVASAERRRADARFQDVRRLANSVIHELHDAIANLPGATPARRLLVTRALEYLDRLAGEARDDLELQRELAEAYQRVAQVQGGAVGANLGDTRGALGSYAKALVLRQALAARSPTEAQDLVGLAVLEFDLGALQRASGQAPLAERSFLSAVSRLEDLRRRGALPEAQRRRIGAVYQRLAEVQAFQGKRAEALGHARKAVAEAEAVWQAQPEDTTARSTLAAASHQLAAALAREQRFEEALARTRQARGLLEAALRENPLDAQHTRVLLYVLNGEGTYLSRLGDTAGAVRVYTRALDVAEEAWRRDPRDRWSQMGVAVAARALASALFERGDARRSAQRYRQALRITSRAVAEDPRYTFARLEMASAEYGLSRALLAEGSGPGVAEACATLARVGRFWTDLQSRGELPEAEAEELVAARRSLARCPSAAS